MFMVIKKSNILILLISMFMIELNGQPTRIKFKQVIQKENEGTFSIENTSQNKENQKILIAITIKDNQYSLPTFLATLETLKCPTENKKCDLW